MQNKPFVTITLSVLTRSLNVGRMGTLTPTELSYPTGDKTVEKKHAVDKAL
jgi:hypothetical protein